MPQFELLLKWNSIDLPALILWEGWRDESELWDNGRFYTVMFTGELSTVTGALEVEVDSRLRP